jgi:hypothetical protein
MFDRIEEEKIVRLADGKNIDLNLGFEKIHFTVGNKH